MVIFTANSLDKQNITKRLDQYDLVQFMKFRYKRDFNLYITQ